jgi:putative nucleotidyltransferase with HDIG domain
MYSEIIKNGQYMECLNKIAELEADRKFCRHDLAHFLDVARLAYIMSLEDGGNVSKDMIYATGLLHDIGRHNEYMNDVRHEITSAEIAEKILMDTGFKENEIIEIKRAILDHRNKDISRETSLSGYIYRADKSSRQCFACGVRDECSWSKDKKNLVIKL